jgi:Asp-tRNA(Asn)/Glu-tRNA(Gln) amidotransferase A subunit family amidase
MTEPRELSIHQAVALLRRGKLTSEALLRSCLERIAEREPDVKAWARVYADEALTEARRLDKKAKRGAWEGPLHGIPLGVKDIFDVQAMETRCGTDAYPVRTAAEDADSVQCLRNAGAIVLGKTHTTAFAFGDPAPTRNPWNLGRTPGGSSAGSAAAVADRMCLGALGTQTAGSVLRPASYNGLVGFKPSFGAVSTRGVYPLSWQLDHVGALTRNVADAHLLWQLMRLEGQAKQKRAKAPQALTGKLPKRVWRIRGLFETEAGPESLAALDTVCRALAKKGVKIVERALPDSFRAVLESHHAILAAEAVVIHEAGYAARRPLFPPKIAELIQEGQKALAAEYVKALRHRQQVIGELSAMLEDVDAAITPSTVAPAPTPETTGPRVFQGPWSYVGFPTITVPVTLAEGRLPLGVQWVSGPGTDDKLFRHAAACETLMPFTEMPA